MVIAVTSCCHALLAMRRVTRGAVRLFSLGIILQAAQLSAAEAGCSGPAISSRLLGVSSQNGAAEQSYERALSRQAEGRYAEAEKAFRTAFMLSPYEDKYVRGLTLYYINHQTYEDAIAVIGAHVKSCGATALGYELEAELLFKKKIFDAALEAVQHSLDLSGSSARMHEMLGLLLAAKRQTGAAIQELEKAAALDPGQPQVRYFYGRFLYTSGRYQDARDQFLACLRLQPDFPRALENLGLSYEGLGDTARAIDSYLQAIVIQKAGNGRDVEPYAYYGALLSRLGQTDKGQEVLREALSISPKSFRANFEMARLLISLGRLEEAEPFLNTAVTLAPRFSRTYFLLGKVRQRQNRQAEAQRYWARFQELDKFPENRDFPLTDR